MRSNHTRASFLATVLIACMLPLATWAQMNIPSLGSAVTQDFNSMGTTATGTSTSNIPAGFRVAAGAGTADWNSGATTLALAAGTSGTGIFTGTSTGGAYNMAQGAMTTSTDRALGFLTSSGFTSPRSVILKLHNNTGAEIGSLDVSWDYEKYRSGTRAFTWTFFHGNTSTPANSDGNGDLSYAGDANNTVISNPPLSQAMTFTISGLSIPANGDYYLRWTYTGTSGSTNAKALAIDNFSVTAQAPPPPDNDECAGAPGLGVQAYGDCPAGSTAGTTISATPSGGSCAAGEADVWYQFYSYSNTSLFLHLAGQGASGMGAELYTYGTNGCDGSSVYCAAGDDHTLSVQPDQYYYLRIYSQVQGHFNICLNQPAANDECTGAIGLGTNAYGNCTGNEITGSTSGATASGGSCNATDNDVWYYFYSYSGGVNFVDLTSVTASGFGLEVFEDACGGTSVYCGSGSSHTVPTVAGHYYYMRVSTSVPGDFTVCVSASVTNDECNSPDYIGTNAYGNCSGNETTGNTAGATASGGSCNATDKDVWYYFPSSTGSATFVDLTSVTASGFGIEVFEDGCGGTSVYCASGSSHTVPTVAGHYYYMRVSTSTPGEFTVCVSASATNDECDNALNLPTYAYGTCAGNETTGTTAGATASGGSCNQTDNDVWYYFSATTGSVTFVDLTSVTASGFGIEVFEDGCGGTSVYCASGSSHTVPTISGHNYYMRVSTSTPGEFTACVSSSAPNDECANSMYVPTNAYGNCTGNETTGTTAGTTASGGSCNQVDDDVWYYFYSTTGSATFVDLTSITASGFGIEVFEDACGGNSVYCASGSNHTVPTTSGHVYYMRVSTSTPGEFNVCVSSSAPNDECDNPVGVGTNAYGNCAGNETTGTTAGATASGGSCNQTYNDVWYYFYSSTGSATFVDLTAITASGFGIEVFEDACGGTSVYCATGSNHTVPTTAGHYYSMRVSTSVPGEFNVCVSSSAPNDECDNVLHLPTNTYGNCAGNETTGTTAGATASGGSCNPTDNDVWYYFYSSTGSATFVDLATITASGFGIEVFEDACGGTSVYCATGSNHTVPTTAGHYYSMRVSTSVPGEFNVCVSSSVPNDECDNVVGLPTNAYGNCPGNETTGTTDGATASGGSCHAADNDVWYTFSSTTGSVTFVDLTSITASGFGIEVFEDNCGGASVYCGSGSNNTVQTIPGHNYYMRVSTSTPGEFNVCVSSSAPNDECDNAVYVYSNAYGNCAGNETAGTTEGATASGGSCHATDNDVWYIFSSTTGSVTFVDLTSITASGFGIEVFEDNCGGTSVYCGSGSNNTVPTTPGHNYYMRVSTSTSGEFNVCVSSSAPNDECENASGVPVNAFDNCSGNETTGTTEGATASGGGCNASDNDVWYIFTSSTGSATFVDLTTITVSGFGIEVFEDNCGGTSVYCGSGANHTVPTTPSHNYYMRISTSTPGEFNVCVSATQPNDECDNAVSLTANTFGNCAGNETTGYTTGATASGGGCGSASNDLWYYFGAGSPSAVYVDLSPVTASGMGIEVFEDACGGTSVYCATGDTHTVPVTSYHGYYMRVYSSTPGEFSVCVSLPPQNDDCSTPVVLNYYSDNLCPDNAVTGSTIGALPSSNAGCSVSSPDVWYQYYNSYSTTVFDLTPNGADGMGIEVFDGCGGTSYYCGTGLHHVIPQIPVGWFYVRVFSSTPGEFSICSRPGTANDACAYAQSLTLQLGADCPSQAVSGTTIDAGPDGAVACQPGSVADVFYYIYSNDATAMDVNLASLGAGGLGLEVLSSCGGSSLYCDSGSSHTFLVQPYTGYWLKVYSTVPGDFTICVSQSSGAEDCLGVPGGPALPGTTCDDGNANTTGDTYQANCVCLGYDCTNILGGNTGPGSSCLVSYSVDGTPFYGAYDENCTCAWTDCEGVAQGPSYPGQSCDDGNSQTANSYWSSACTCTDYYDCDGTLNGPALPGTACSGYPYGNAGVYDTNCSCTWTDCAGTANGYALPGTACDDGVATTTNDTWDANCICIGGTLDCNGDPDGTASLDNCGVCSGGNTGITPCVADCNGDFGGTASLDNCGVCTGGNTGVTPCVSDCNGDFGGNALLDNCGMCVGGNTGLAPCVAPSNNECSSASSIPIGAYGSCPGSGTIGTTVGATHDGIPGGSCGSSFPSLATGADVWYTFNAAGNYNVVLLVDPITASQVAWEVFRGSCPGPGTETIACGIASYPLTLALTNPGANYLIRVTSSASPASQGTFLLCLTKVAPPPDCAGVPGGTAYYDNCGTCVGGSTGITPCTADCNGVFGGTALLDNCGVCAGGNTGITPCTADCNGVFGGTASLDNCGVCAGGNTGVTACVADCQGDFGGTASLDNCGVCAGGNTGVTPCIADCHGDFGGTASLDNCGVCAGGNTGITPCIADCNGVFGGTASLDNCGVCAGGNTGITPCIADCNGVFGGTASLDNCGVCAGGNTGITPCVADCNGVFGGTASLDNCGVCTGGNTGITPCVADCNGVYGGTASLDNCGVCAGGNTGVTPCVADCNGVSGGTASLDNCGVCTGGNTGVTPCVADCNGVFGGTASLDNCGVCAGGNTGVTPCVADCNGDFGGTASLDNCGVCTGGNTGVTPCAADCNGVFGGTASLDNCGVCAGGNTGVAPCVADCNGDFGGTALPGSSCEDGNASTVNDTWSASCTCAGIPIGGCTENVTIDLRTDAHSQETGWEILLENTNQVVCKGGYPDTPYLSGITTPITSNCCLPAGNYRLRVLDSMGDGFVSAGFTGGYQLRESGANGRRIIDNFGNFSTGSTSAIANVYENGSFSVPLGDVKPIFSSCDKLDWTYNRFLVTSANSFVTGAFDPTLPRNAQASNLNSGYEYWFFDPNGGFSYRRFISHAYPDVGAPSPGTANTACHFRITNALPANTLLNLRIRGRVNGINQAFGPACLFKIDAAMAFCPEVKLQDDPANVSDYSCGVTKTFGGSSQTSNRITANPPYGLAMSPPSPVIRYQFRFRIDAEGICIVRPPQTSALLVMNWNVAPNAVTKYNTLRCGSTYQVDVRISRDGGATWCVGAAGSSQAAACGDPAPWGKVCNVTISTSTFCPPPMQGGGSSMAQQHEGNGTLTMYPNPNRGDELTIALSEVEAGVRTVSVDIFDLTGQRISARTIAVADGFVNSKVKFDAELASGMYLVNITAGSKTYTERLVIQK